MDPKWVRVLCKPLAGGEMVFYVCSGGGGGGGSRVAQVDLEYG